MKKLIKRIISLSLCIILLTSCGSSVQRLNINGTYTGQGMTSYEAIVEDGVITIYSTGFFEKTIYWYGTCNASDLNSDNILISRKLARQRQNDFFGFGFGFGSSINESGANEKQIKFTDKTLTFVYDLSGMSINQVTLYKINVENQVGGFDSNADKLDPNYKDPTIDVPPPPGQTKERPTEPPTTEAPKNDGIILPDGPEYSL